MNLDFMTMTDTPVDAQEDEMASLSPHCQVIERDPNGKQPREPGAKLDMGKPAAWRGLLDYFPRALLAVSEVSTFGAKKYDWKGWESVPDGEARYADAMARHVLENSAYSEQDEQSRMEHWAHIAWNALAVLELKLRK